MRQLIYKCETAFNAISMQFVPIRYEIGFLGILGIFHGVFVCKSSVVKENANRTVISQNFVTFMARYDRAITVFSPDGELLQVQYAQEAVRKGSAVVGIRGPDIIVLAVERRIVPKLQMERLEKKIVALDEHIILAFAGLRADARVLITRAQTECQSYRLMIEDPPSVEYISRFLAHWKQQFTHRNGRRPFGISCVIGGFDYDGTPHLFQTEPSGIYYEWKATSTGREDKAIREFLEKNYNLARVSTARGAVKLAIAALLEVCSPPRDFDVSVLKRNSPFKLLDQDIVKAIIEEVQRDKDVAKR